MPHVDRLALEGMRFTNAHTPSAVCTPTRYGILTGRYCWRTRLKYRVLDRFDPPLIEEGQLTVPSFLKQRGYRGLSGAGSYGDFVIETDAFVGAVLDALDRTNITDNTLVMFTSRNGRLYHGMGCDRKR
ncbi:MAG: sulfatase-like hydrolase/transferase [Planctomycetaceae bacterium]|nr:sulfatase-like hydrolase/transferase [Planctomycetales bacterium]MCB9925230.1 sulfatase-like hydrolase/transferase [Planctomycetaceae bacterium]